MAEPSLIAGFDAGQTHTSCRLSDACSGEMLGEGQGPGVCHLAAADGPARFRQALQVSLVQARLHLPHTGTPLLAAGIGASGIEVGSSVQELGRQLAAEALQLPLERVVVTGDERTALRGAMGNHQGGAGILVISGTGSIAVGRNGENREHRCGGWGWLLDGSGSAMDIGHDALMASVRMSDGRDRDTALRQTLWSALAVGSAQELKALVVQADFGPAGFARLAPYVDQLAEAGDAEAMAIIERSGTGLADLVAGVAAALDLSSPRVAAVGGAITHLGMFQRSWCAELAARLPEATLVAPHRDACHGALLMAGDLLTDSADNPGASARCA